MCDRKLISIFIFWGLFKSCWIYAQTVISSKQKSFKINPNTALWYKTPASKWDEVLPVGNSRLGAMVYVKTDKNRYSLMKKYIEQADPIPQLKKTVCIKRIIEHFLSQ